MPLRPDGRCDQACLSASPLAPIGVTMLHLACESSRGRETCRVTPFYECESKVEVYHLPQTTFTIVLQVLSLYEALHPKLAASSIRDIVENGCKIKKQPKLILNWPLNYYCR